MTCARTLPVASHVNIKWQFRYTCIPLQWSHYKVLISQVNEISHVVRKVRGPNARLGRL